MTPKPDFAAVHLSKLKDVPQATWLLQLLVLLNDLDSTVYLTECLYAHESDLVTLLDYKRRDGAVLYLLRQQTALVAITLYDVVTKMKTKIESERSCPQKENSLWKFFTTEKDFEDRLLKLIEKLESPNGVTARYLRDKLAFHVDRPALNIGLERLCQQQALGGIIRKHSPQRFRCLFVDDVLSQSWQQQAEGDESYSPQKYADFIRDLKTSTADFIYALVNSYCFSLGIFATKEEKAEMWNQLKAPYSKG